MSTIIKVEGLSKSYLIGQGGKERYTALRDVVTNNAKKLFSFPRHVARSSYNKEFWALKEVSFEINQGDRVGIIGRNGAGKSTLLKILSRITEPTKGRIRMNGRVASLLEVGTGFHPELTGRENIFLNGAILGMSREEIRGKFDEIVDFAEIEKFLDTPVKRYSSGMYVRLAFAVAAHLEPEILIVDEVLAVGDAQFQKKCLGKIEDVNKSQGRTILFVSHNLGIVSQLCNKGIFLKEGAVLKNDIIANVIQAYTSGDNASSYTVSESVARVKQVFFRSIFTTDINGAQITDFSFDDSIVLHFEFYATDAIPTLQVGIGLQDKAQSRIFTVLKPVSFFKRIGENLFKGSMEVPGSLIAPNLYSFVCALWTKDGQMYDVVENAATIKIHDNGTDLALYEGIDYGCILVNSKWQ